MSCSNGSKIVFILLQIAPKFKTKHFCTRHILISFPKGYKISLSNLGLVINPTKFSHSFPSFYSSAYKMVIKVSSISVLKMRQNYAYKTVKMGQCMLLLPWDSVMVWLWSTLFSRLASVWVYCGDVKKLGTADRDPSCAFKIYQIPNSSPLSWHTMIWTALSYTSPTTDWSTVSCFPAIKDWKPWNPWNKINLSSLMLNQL